MGGRKGLVAQWLSVLCWHGNVKPKDEGLIVINVKLLFVLSKACAVQFVWFVQWNPVIISLVIPVENSMIILTRIMLHRENYIQKTVHQNPTGIGGEV